MRLVLALPFFLIGALAQNFPRVDAADPPAAASQPATAPADPNADSASDIATLKLLDEKVREISADQQPLEKCLLFLQDNVPVKIFINWKALKGAGVEKDTSISLNLKEASLHRVIATILSNAAPKGDLDFVVEDGMIVISTREDLQSAGHRVTRVYNVRDLLVPAGSGGSTQPAATAASLAADLRKLLQGSAADAVIKPGAESLTEFNGMFVIETTANTHRKIAELLAKLRAANGAASPVKAGTGK